MSCGSAGRGSEGSCSGNAAYAVGVIGEVEKSEIEKIGSGDKGSEDIHGAWGVDSVSSPRKDREGDGDLGACVCTCVGNDAGPGTGVLSPSSPTENTASCLSFCSSSSNAWSISALLIISHCVVAGMSICVLTSTGISSCIPDPTPIPFSPGKSKTLLSVRLGILRCHSPGPGFRPSACCICIPGSIFLALLHASSTSLTCNPVSSNLSADFCLPFAPASRNLAV